MPFRLNNAPSTFQGLTNQLFKLYLRRFVLVFFDDILVYSPDWKTHLQYLKSGLDVLKTNSLLAKHNKCTFGVSQIKYLRHVLSREGIATDPTKIAAILEWPVAEYH